MSLIPEQRSLSLRERAGAVLSSIIGAFFGVLPHVLHHVGPLAGAALLTGAGGTALFGAIGLVAAIPFLLRVRRHSGSWRAPAALLALFALMFSLSALVLGPAISGDDTDQPPRQQAPERSGHDAHH